MKAAHRQQVIDNFFAALATHAPEPTPAQERAVYACAIHNMQNGWCIVCGSSDHEG